MNIENKDKIIEGMKNTLKFQSAEIEALKKENDQYKRALRYYSDRGFERAKDVLNDFSH